MRLSFAFPLFAVASAAFAQPGPAAPNLAAPEIVLRTLSPLSSRDAKVGDRFQLTVASPVTVDGGVVIPVGSLATGEITRVTRKGMFGKSGKLEARLVDVEADGRRIKLDGIIGDRGAGNTVATVGAVLFVWPAAFFITGTSAVVPSGTGAIGRLVLDASRPASDAGIAPVAALD